MNVDSAGVSGRWSRLPLAWRWVLVLGGIVALIALFYAEENWRGRHAWEKYKRQLAARGEPVEVSQLIPPPVPDEQNFAMTPFLAPLFDFFPGTQKPRDTNGFAQTQQFPAVFNKAADRVKIPKAPRNNSWVSGPTDLPAWVEALQQGTNSSDRSVSKILSNHPTPTEAAASVLSLLAPYDPVIEELRAASRRPYARFNLRYENEDPAAILLPHLAVLKRQVQLLGLRASAELAIGQTERALEDLNLMFSLADSIRTEPIAISHFVRMAMLQLALQPVAEGLANHQWSDAQLSALEQRLGSFDLCADGVRALQGERVVFGEGIINYVRQASNRYRVLNNLGLVSGQQDNSFDWKAALTVLIPSGWFYLEQLNYNRALEDNFLPVIDAKAHQINPAAAKKAEARLDALIRNRGPALVLHHRFFIAVLMPALSRTMQRTASTHASIDLARTACALERYRLAQGHYPELLEALSPQFISNLPGDIINGQPLKYRRTEDGQYILYSVGWNETDEGGELAVSKNGGTVDPQKGDWVWRLPPPR